ncbi:MAG TPA: hypothetical protein VJ204_09925, partial [Solirubrobacterales bacterium]|nr:hypothetical protein [Solirubrobacterales bacterium]
QKPLELILARNLMSALSTPAFLVDEGGLLVFYNEAAGALLGKGFDEVGHVGPTWPTSSNPLPSRLPAASLKKTSRPPSSTRKAGVESADIRFLARINSSGF